MYYFQKPIIREEMFKIEDIIRRSQSIQVVMKSWYCAQTKQSSLPSDICTSCAWTVRCIRVVPIRYFLFVPCFSYPLVSGLGEPHVVHPQLLPVVHEPAPSPHRPQFPRTSFSLLLSLLFYSFLSLLLQHSIYFNSILHYLSLTIPPNTLPSSHSQGSVFRVFRRDIFLTATVLPSGLVVTWLLLSPNHRRLPRVCIINLRYLDDKII